MKTCKFQTCSSIKFGRFIYFFVYEAHFSLKNGAGMKMKGGGEGPVGDQPQISATWLEIYRQSLTYWP